MLNSKGKLRGDTPSNQMRTVQTTGSVEPDDKAITQGGSPSSTYQQLLTLLSILRQLWTAGWVEF